MKSSYKSCIETKLLFNECVKKIKGIKLRNKSITTSSIYCKTPDGFSLRIGDHKGREKYSYKWNLDPTIKKGYWKKEYNKIDKRNYWRYYTGNVDELAKLIKENIIYYNKQKVKN